MRGRRRKVRGSKAVFNYKPAHKSNTFSRERQKHRRTVIATIAVFVALFALAYIVGITLYIEDGSAWLDFAKLNMKGRIVLYVPPSPIINDTQKPDEGKPIETSKGDGEDDVTLPASAPAKSKPVNFDTLKDQQLFNNFLSDALTEGFKGIVVEYKDIEGTVYGKTENPAVNEAGAMSKEAVDMKALTDIIKQKGLIPVAKISCFKDNLAGVHYLPYAIKVNGGEVRWLDRDLKRWLNPAYKESRDYELSVIKDAVADGFECVYLYNAEFPVQVKSDIIEYPKEHRDLDKTEVIDGFIKDVKRAISEVSENQNRDQYCCLIVQLADKSLNDEYYEKKTGHSLTKLLSSTDMVAINVTKPEETGKTLSTLGIDSNSKIAALVARDADMVMTSQYFKHIVIK